MATQIQEKVIFSDSNTAAPAVTSSTIDVQIPVVPSEALSLEGRVQAQEEMMRCMLDCDVSDIIIEKKEERFVGVSNEELRDIIDFVRRNPALTQATFLSTARGDVAPVETVREDDFVEVPTAISDHLAVTNNDSRPGIISRVKQSFWSTVSYLYPFKK